MQAHHYGLTVSSLAESLAFYRGTLGLEVVAQFNADTDGFRRTVGVEEGSADVAFLGGDTFFVELFEYDPAGDSVREGKLQNNAIGAHHLAFDVEDAREWYDRLSDDVEFVAPPASGDSGFVATYLYDPDGNMVELLESETIQVPSL